LIKKIPAKKMFIILMIAAVILNVIGLISSNRKLFFDLSVVLLGLISMIRPSLGLEYLMDEQRKKGELFDLLFPERVFVLIGFFGGLAGVAFGLMDYFGII
jgi:uncharacterized membrane protein YfcA